MADAYIGEIRAFGFNFAPLNWAYCNGKLMAISQNTSLFQIIGTTYGGDGVSTFGLPNLQGQVPMHWGNAPGGFGTVIGHFQVQPDVTLTTNQIPLHNHLVYGAVTASGSPASQRVATPSGNAYMGASAAPNRAYQTATAAPTNQFNTAAIGAAGNSLPHDNMQPYLTLNFCICLNGYYPARS